MFDTPDIMRIAQELARHAGSKQAIVARNVANADTPGYRAQDITPFHSVFQTSTEMRSTRSDHMDRTVRDRQWQAVDAGGRANPNGNTVSLEEELMRGASAKSTHDLALTIYRSSMDLLRTSIGRGR